MRTHTSENTITNIKSRLENCFCVPDIAEGRCILKVRKNSQSRIKL